MYPFSVASTHFEFSNSEVSQICGLIFDEKKKKTIVWLYRDKEHKVKASDNTESDLSSTA